MCEALVEVACDSTSARTLQLQSNIIIMRVGTIIITTTMIVPTIILFYMVVSIDQGRGSTKLEDLNVQSWNSHMATVNLYLDD